MANSSANVTVSSILKNKSSFEDEPREKSREDWRKAKELEEARKAGTAPAAVDEEDNPHIPRYISATPWYFGAQGLTLKHQKPQPEKQKQFSSIDEWYNREVDSAHVATKYREGACENCGAMTHKREDCMERSRKVGAKYTNSKIAPDEFAQPELSMDYDSKRDRWTGYDPSEHRAIVEKYQKIEEAKGQMRVDKLDAEKENDERDKDEENSKIAPDEFTQPELSMDYDGKTDRWPDYDPSEHRAIVEEYQKIVPEEAKGQMRADKSLLLAQTEHYAEYIHMPDWGSYCYSFIKNYSCTGESEKRAAEAINDSSTLDKVPSVRNEMEETRKMEKLLKTSERKRPYNSMYETKELTTEEIEAYPLKRKRDDEDQFNDHFSFKDVSPIFYSSE